MEPAELGLTVVRGVQIAASLSAFGVAVFWSVMAPPVLQVADDATRESIEATFRRLFRRSLAVAVAAALVWLVAQASFMAEAESLADAAAAVWPVLSDTHFGHVLAARFLLLVISALALGSGANRIRRAAAVVAVGLALILQTWSTHAAATKGIDGAVLLGAESLHLLAAGAWLGSLAPLFLTVGALAPDLGGRAARRFSPLGILCVAILAGTALAQSWILIGGLPRFLGTDYGRVALVKLALLLLLLAFAAANRFRYAPAMRGTTGGDAKRRLRWSIAAETAAALLAVLAASLLADLPPARHQQPVWPFAWQLNLSVLDDPDFGPEAVGGLLRLGAALLLAAVALFWRRFRWLLLAAGVAAAAWAVPHLDLLLARAYPTSFYRSPTGFSAAAIARGAELYPEHCAACHGSDGRGDGPSAKSLPLPPADLTAEHLLNHSDGELFWWLSHGIDAPRGGLAMPGFADGLSEDDRWALVDYVRAHNAGAAIAAGGQWAHLVAAPDLSVQCSDGREIALTGLQGKVVRIIAGDGAGAARAAETSAPDLITVELERGTPAATAAACATSDPEAWAAYAIVSGVDQDGLAGTQFLIDGQGWLRARWRPGDPTDWTDSKALLAEVTRLRAEPVAARPERGQRP
jgi:putative copper export protein/mono/diheme cytochrome c family protein